VTSTSEVVINARSGLVIDGRGYILNSSGYHNAVRLQCATGITIRNMVIVGSNPAPGTLDPNGREHAHGLHVNGGSNLRFEGLTIDKMQGDGLYVAQCGTTWADGVIIRDSMISNNGRMGIAVVAGKNVRAERMRFHNIAFHIVVVEPDWNSNYRQGGTDLVFTGGVSTGWVGRFSSGLVNATAFYLGTPYGAQAGKYAPILSRVTIEGYHVRDGRLGIATRLETLNGYRMSNVVIRNNRGDVQSSGVGGGIVEAGQVDVLTVTGNTQPVNSGIYAVAPVGASGLSVSANTGTNLAGQIKPS